MLVGATRRDLSVELFGLTLPSPLFMAPVGRGRAVRPGRPRRPGHGPGGGPRPGVPMVASTLTVDPMEEVAAEFGDALGFFQLYTPTDRELAESLVRHAAAAGFKGIVVTLDTWITGWRPRDLATSNFPQLHAGALPGELPDRPGLPWPARGPRAGPGRGDPEMGRAIR